MNVYQKPNYCLVQLLSWSILSTFLASVRIVCNANSFTAIIFTSLYIGVSPFEVIPGTQTFTPLGEKREKNVLIHLLWAVVLHVKDLAQEKTKARHISQQQYMSNKLYNDHVKIFLSKKL